MPLFNVEMKTLRPWLLVLLMLLVPLRGALAAAQSCPVAGGQQRVEQVVHDHAAHHGAHVHATSDHAASSTHADHDGAGSKCSACALFCSVAGLLSTSVAIPDGPPGAAVFPRIATPALSFVSGGQDRPPRSI